MGRQYTVQRIRHRASRAGKREDVGAAGDDGAGARLNCRGADALMAERAEQLAETGNILAVEAAQRLWRHVAAGEAGAAGGDNDIDRGIVDPVVKARDDQVGLVLDERARGADVAGAGQQRFEGVARARSDESRVGEEWVSLVAIGVRRTFKKKKTQKP